MSSKEEYVRQIFDRIAPRYDLMNTLLSFNRDKAWRRVAVKLSGARPGFKVLDVCCGTGMLTLELARAVSPGGKVTGLDFSPAMLAIARERVRSSPFGRSIEFIQGNAMSLPFPEGSFDCATIAFALRNVPDIEGALLEMKRVLRPGGRLVSLELAKPSWPLFKQIYYLYFDRLVPLLGKWGSGADGPYSYLPRSLKAFPHQRELLETFNNIGLIDTVCLELTGGIAAVHVGTKP
ncbi:MAG: demethylmenaquinone methyltransferase / 2-methoxy-6-polyprenyl,4-benzoquinol methylase [Clostridia bacterium]|nr:demethylmenaquinone methyltransferase / 2-methoxy-6-polyprenyl,4-benzoquinol methylase [Clostridia bacterium]